MGSVCIVIDFLVCFARVVECSGADGEVSQLGGAWVWAEDGRQSSLANISDVLEGYKEELFCTYLEFGIFAPVVGIQLLEESFIVRRLFRHIFDP